MMHMTKQRRFLCLATALAGVLAFAAPAGAWGPKTQLAIVTNALHLLSKTSNIPLERLERHLRDGAMVSLSGLERIYARIEDDPTAAIESEMYLLETAQSGRVDPYFAFRLGTLGKLVAEAVSPMRGENAS